MPGTRIEIRPDAAIDVSHWDKGRIYPGRVARDVFGRDGNVSIARDAPAELIVRQTGPGQFVLGIL